MNKSDPFLASVARGAGRRPGRCSGAASLLKLALATRYDDKALESTSLWHVAKGAASSPFRVERRAKAAFFANATEVGTRS